MKVFYHFGTQDDPLSALDVHVGRHLFEEGIMKLLVNNNKTVILVTHQLQYLNRADLVSVAELLHWTPSWIRHHSKVAVEVDSVGTLLFD